MYPFFRFGLEMARARAADRLPVDGVHVSHHRCWPWDLDPWIELNNGRTLTLYDLGRMPLAVRTGFAATLRAHRWGITVAGASVRYRRRVRAFQRVEMRSAFIGRDARFLYIEQAMFGTGRQAGEALSAALIRGAVTSAQGIVPTDRVLHGIGGSLPTLPPWVEAWAAAEALRPWPPEFAQ